MRKPPTWKDGLVNGAHEAFGEDAGIIVIENTPSTSGSRSNTLHVNPDAACQLHVVLATTGASTPVAALAGVARLRLVVR